MRIIMMLKENYEEGKIMKYEKFGNISDFIWLFNKV